VSINSCSWRVFFFVWFVVVAVFLVVTVSIISIPKRWGRKKTVAIQQRREDQVRAVRIGKRKKGSSSSSPSLGKKAAARRLAVAAPRRSRA
jgi:cytochrome c biogenesis protein ResB